MKHNFYNVRDELDRMYLEYDSFAVYRLVYDEIDRLNTHFYDNFFNFNRDTPIKRLENRTEYDLIESFWLRYESIMLSTTIQLSTLQLSLWKRIPHCASLEPIFFHLFPSTICKVSGSIRMMTTQPCLILTEEQMNKVQGFYLMPMCHLFSHLMLHRSCF